MDAAGGSIISQSPVTMAHEQLPSPLTYEGPYGMVAGLDMSAVTAGTSRRRSSKGGPPGGIVKRSASSPNVRSLSTGSDPSLSLAEKRRNKLGYHRTSVACVHCRRRKIRCLLAPDDPQNRCSNCIRLKKECNFFPVDQQPPNERRPRTGSKIETKSGGSVSSSGSPTVGGARSSEHGEFPHFQHLPHAASYPTMMMGSSGMSPPGSAAPHSASFDHGHGWDMRFFEGHSIPTNHSSGEEAHGHPFWKVPDTPLTPASFSPYSSAPPGAGVHGYPPWPAPIRSMSYGQIDERHDAHYGDLRRSTMGDMPPPSGVVGGHTGSTSSQSGPGEQPGAYGNLPLQHHHQSWGMLPTQSPKSVEFNGQGWYADPQLAKVQEDEVSHFGGEGIGGNIYAGGVHR